MATVPGRPLECLVEDVFRFSDGRTVFALSALSVFPSTLVGPAELIVGGKKVADLTIHGEYLMTPSGPGSRRAVFTKNHIDKDAIGDIKGKSLLRWS